MNNRLQNKKPIGLWSAIAIEIGGMIGAGIFSILGIATGITGNLIYVSFNPVMTKNISNCLLDEGSSGMLGR